MHEYRKRIVYQFSDDKSQKSDTSSLMKVILSIIKMGYNIFDIGGFFLILGYNIPKGKFG